MLFWQIIINGLNLGAIYALVAVGYTLIFGVLRLINFAHGDLLMVGAYLGWILAKVFQPYFAPGILLTLLVLFFTVILTTVIGLLVERLVYRQLYAVKRIYMMVAALGVSLFLENLMQWIFGPSPQFFPTLYSATTYQFGFIQINSLEITVFILATTTTFGLYYLIQFTKTGLAMRAVAHNHETASLMGIPVQKTICYTFMLSAGLAGMAGVLTALTYPKIDPLMGIMWGIKAFIAAILGGIGHLGGAVFGALFLGLTESLTVTYLTSTYRDAFTFIILVIVLIYKPYGLFGRAVLDKP